MVSSHGATFSEWLAGLTAEQLTALALARPDTLQPLPRDLRAFAARASARASVARAVDHLRAPDLSLLVKLAEAAGERLRPIRLDAVAGGDDLPSAQRLLGLGLLWPHEQEAAGAGGSPSAEAGASFPPLDPSAEVRVQAEAARAVRGEGVASALAATGAGARPPDAEVTSLPEERATRLLAGTVTATIGLMIATVDAIDAEPLRRLRSGGVARREEQRLSRTLDAEGGELGFAIELAYAADLIAEDEEHWRLTPGADEFLRLDPPEQWAQLVEAWWSSPRQGALDDEAPLLAPGIERAALPVFRREVLAELGGQEPGTAIERVSLAARLRWRRPLAFARQEELLPGLLEEAIRLGLIARPLRGEGVALSESGRLWLDGGTGQARAAVAALLPAHTREVLLQADLTAIVPGIPAPELRAFLRSIAVPHGRGQGQLYRFTPDSVLSGLHRGLGAEEILERLEAWCPTGLPQPLSYLIADASRRFGRVRLGRARGYVRTSEPDELERLLARQPMGLGLVRIAPTVAITQSPASTVAQALEEIGVRAVAEQDGTPVVSAQAPERAPAAGRRAVAAQPRALPDAAVRAAAARWLAPPEPTAQAAPGEEGPEAIVGQLRDAAALGRPVVVTAADSRGNAHELRIVPLSVQGGRIRARRIADDAELTLVVHRVRDVRPVS